MLHTLQSDNDALIGNLMDVKLQLAQVEEERDTYRLKLKDAAQRQADYEAQLKKFEGLLGQGDPKSTGKKK